MRRGGIPFAMFNSAVLLPALAGLPLPGLPPSDLSAQLVELRVDVEEGAEFVRTARQIHEEGGPSSRVETRWTVGIRVDDLRADGGGVLHYTVDAFSWEHEGRTDPAMAEALVGTTTRLEFRPGGVVDLSRWQIRDRGDEAAAMEAVQSVEIVGPAWHAAGHPVGLPPALRIGETFRVGPWGGGPPQPSSFTLEAVEEVNGRRVAHIRLGSADPEDPAADDAGFLRIDLDQRRVIEWEFTVRVSPPGAAGSGISLVREERVERRD